MGALWRGRIDGDIETMYESKKANFVFSFSQSNTDRLLASQSNIRTYAGLQQEFANQPLLMKHLQTPRSLLPSS